MPENLESSVSRHEAMATVTNDIRNYWAI